jgi:peroxiredoxin
MKWDSKAASMYGVSSIPKTFLVDKDGKIAAVDPRYNLEEAILKVL